MTTSERRDLSEIKKQNEQIRKEVKFTKTLLK